MSPVIDEARQDVFNYIEMFYNLQRKHARNGVLSPISFEQQQKLKPLGVRETRSYSYVETQAFHIIC